MDSNIERDGREGDGAPTYATSLSVPNVQEMVRKNVLDVRERYIRTREDVHEIGHTLSPEIPVIDLSSLSRRFRKELEKLDQACRDWGFFLVCVCLFFSFSFNAFLMQTGVSICSLFRLLMYRYGT